MKPLKQRKLKIDTVPLVLVEFHYRIYWNNHIQPGIYKSIDEAALHIQTTDIYAQQHLYRITNPNTGTNWKLTKDYTPIRLEQQ